MVEECGGCHQLLAEVEKSLKSKAGASYSDNSMPQYLEVASGFIGAGVETLGSRAALELDKSQGWDVNQPYMRSRPWVNWGTGLVSAIALFWKGEQIKRQHPKLYEAIQGVGHAAVANSAPDLEEQVTGVKLFKPIPNYTKKTITNQPDAKNQIDIKALRQQPGEIDVLAMNAPALTLG